MASVISKRNWISYNENFRKSIIQARSTVITQFYFNSDSILFIELKEILTEPKKMYECVVKNHKTHLLAAFQRKVYYIR